VIPPGPASKAEERGRKGEKEGGKGKEEGDERRMEIAQLIVKVP